MLEIRNGNEALQFLLQECQPFDNNTEFLVENLPVFGNILYNLSEKEAYHLISLDGQERDIKLIPNITNSVFDIVLTVYFSESLIFSNNKEVSSVLVDALLFQATGNQATSVISDEDFRESSENCRGIYKFYLGRQKLQHIKDSEGFILGKEVATILTGGHDAMLAFLVASHSLLIRFDAKAEIRRLLHNETADLNRKRKLEESISNILANLSKSLKGS